MALNYEYNEELAYKADEAANKLAEPGAYVGTFKRVWGVTAETGSSGLEFEFDAPGSGKAVLTIFVQDSDGKKLFGAGFLNALMFFFGIKRLESVSGTIELYDKEARARVETQGDTYPALCDKPIGLVLQKRLYSSKNGAEGSSLDLVGVYQPETRLTFTEIKEKKTRAAKIDSLLKSLKVKDTRKKHMDETQQPALGGLEGGY